jgi:hypothetical protein
MAAGHAALRACIPPDVTQRGLRLAHDEAHGCGMIAPLMLTRCLLLALWLLHVSSASAQEIAGGVYGQSTGDERHLMPQLLVRTPRSMRAHAEASYLVDVWSRASVVQTPDAKVWLDNQYHHELSGRVGYDWDQLRAGAHYRYVHRQDYVSHTFDMPVAYRLSDQVSILSVQPYLRLNHITRVGDANFSQSSQMLGLRAGYQPWLGGRTIGQVAYELQYAGGYLSSPYYYVGVGAQGPSNGCAAVVYCFPENLPGHRTSHAIVLLLRRALSESISAGLRYRFFIDDWSMMSHTIEPDVAWSVWPGGLLRLRYRAYFQSATAAYREAMELPLGGDMASRYTASDPRWSALQSHRVSLDLEHTFGSRFPFTTFLSLGFYRVINSVVVAERTTALEATLWLLLAF